MFVMRSASLHAETLVGNVPKCADLENLSITTMIIVFPWYTRRLTTKSIAISSQIAVGGGIRL